MQLSQNASIINGSLWVTPEFCMNSEVPLPSIKSGMSRFRKEKTKRWENYPDQKLRGKALILFDSIDWESVATTIPNKDQIISELAIYEKEQQLSQKKPIESLWQPFYLALDAKYYQDNFNVNSGRANGRDRAKELAICCAILRMLNAYSTKAKIQKHTGYGSKKELQETIFNYIANYAENGLYGLPSTYRNFKPKLNEFVEALESKDHDARSTLINARFGNDLGVKFDDTHRNVMIEVYCKNPQKNDKLFCYEDYKAIMTKDLGYSEDNLVGYSRFKQKTLERDVQIIASKCMHGDSYYETHVRPFIIRKAPEYSMSLIAGDGWMPGRTVRQVSHVVQPDGTRKQVIRNRAMTVWFWFDWKSSAIISHHISPTETSEGVRKSFRKVIGFMGVCPRSVMLDKSLMKQADIVNMFETSDVFIQPKRAYNPKSNIAERNNKEANKHHRNIDEYWVDVTNNTVNFKHNDEHVRGQKPMEEADFRDMVLKIIERHNHLPRKSLKGQTPWQVLQDNINPDCRSFDPLEMTYIFGSTRNPKVRNYQFTVDIATKKYRYIIPEESILTYNQLNPKNDKVLAYFDEMHMNTVDIYAYGDIEDKSTHRYICTAVDAESDAINAARIEEDLDEKFAKQRSRGAVLDNWIDEELEDHEMAMAEMGLDHASVRSTSQDRFKEAHSNAVSLAYRRYHVEREEDDGNKVSGSEKINTPWTPKEKLKRQEEEFGDKWKE